MRGGNVGKCTALHNARAVTGKEAGRRMSLQHHLQRRFAQRRRVGDWHRNTAHDSTPRLVRVPCRMPSDQAESPQALLARVRVATADEIRTRSSGEVTRAEWTVRPPRAGGLLDASIFGDEVALPLDDRRRVDMRVERMQLRGGPAPGPTRFGHIELHTAVPHPLEDRHGELTVIPVLPPRFRPIEVSGARDFAASDINDLYQVVIARAVVLGRLRGLMAPPDVTGPQEAAVRQAVEHLMTNRGPSCRRTPSGRPLLPLQDVLWSMETREDIAAVFWALGLTASWDGARAGEPPAQPVSLAARFPTPHAPVPTEE
jgi:hypothetical protein